MNKINVIILAFLLSFMGAGIASGQSAETGWKYQIGTTGFGTLCYPVSVPFYHEVEDEDGQTKEVLQGFRAFTVSGMQGDKLVLVEIPPLDESGNSNSIPENTPVIVYGEPGKTVTFECGNPGTFDGTDIPTTSTNLLAGTTKGKTIQGDTLYIMQNHAKSGLAFYRCNGKDENNNYINYTVAQFRCYLELPKKSASAQSLSFSVPENDSSASGISSPEIATTPMSDGIYSLSGVRVDNPKSGEVYVMVIGGRAVKMIIK